MLLTSVGLTPQFRGHGDFHHAVRVQPQGFRTYSVVLSSTPACHGKEPMNRLIRSLVSAFTILCDVPALFTPRHRDLANSLIRRL